MVRLIKSLFAISDGLAWLLLFFAAICTVAAPVVVPAYRRVEHGDASILPVVSIALLCACVAVGAHGLARRRAWALVLVLLPAIVELCFGRIAVAVMLGIPMLVVFGTPYLFALMHVWGGRRSGIELLLPPLRSRGGLGRGASGAKSTPSRPPPSLRERGGEKRANEVSQGKIAA